MTIPPTVTRAAADIGGTFTDVAVLTPDGRPPPESSLSEQSDAGTPASAGTSLLAGTGLAVPATNEYIACTVGPQYATRAVPDAIDRAIRQRVKRDEKSLDAVVVDAIARGLELDAKPAVYTDLDDLIGT